MSTALEMKRKQFLKLWAEMYGMPKGIMWGAFEGTKPAGLELACSAHHASQVCHRPYPHHPEQTFNHAHLSPEPAFPLGGKELIYSRSKTSLDGWLRTIRKTWTISEPD